MDLIFPQRQRGHKTALLLEVQPRQGAVVLLRYACCTEHIVFQLAFGISVVQNKKRQQKIPLVAALEILQQLFRCTAVGGKVRGKNVHVVAVPNSLFLLLNFHGVKVCDFPLYHFYGFRLFQRLNMDVDNKAAVGIKEISQYSVGQLRRNDLQKTCSAELAAHLEHTAILERKGGWRDKVLGGKPASGKPLPVKVEAFSIRVHDAVQHLQALLAVQHTGHRTHDFEVALNIQRDTRQPCPCRLEVIGFNGIGNVFGFHAAVVAAGKLPLENVRLLLPDRV